MLKHQRELTLPRLNAAPTASHCRASMRLPRAGNQPVQARRPLPPFCFESSQFPGRILLARACLGMNLNVLCGARMLDAKLLSVVHSACGVSFCLSKTPRLFVFRLAAAGIRAGAAARKAEARTPSSRRGSPCRSCGACSATPTATRSCSRRPVQHWDLAQFSSSSLPDSNETFCVLEPSARLTLPRPTAAPTAASSSHPAYI